MKHKLYFLRAFLCALTVFLTVTPVSAEVKFKWGPYSRVRYEYWKNLKDMDNCQSDNRSFFRVKTSLWGQADFNEDFNLFAKLTNEFRAYTYFGGATSSVPDKSAAKKGYHFDINEVVFDNLYADVKNFMDLPLDLRLGRQDFPPNMYGEGFLLADGTPGDGSRTYYFNALKASLRAGENNTIDFIYINDPRDDEFLPVINRTKLVQVSNPRLDKAPQNLNTTDEDGYVLYWKNKALKNLNLEGYYIYKTEAEEGGTGMQSEKSRISTFGSFAKYNLEPYTFRGQLAYQCGDYGNQDRSAVGGYGYIDRDFKDSFWSPRLSLGYTYLSGNKSGGDKVKAWDPLFSRYPWISELYILSMASDSGVGIVGYWTNLQIYRMEFVLRPTPKLKLSFWYNFLRSNQQVAASSVCSGSGRNRGHLPQAKIEYAFNKNVSAYFLGEYLIPGNFYKDRDPAVFLRSELQLKF
jgi:hypothetical protein